MQLWTVDTSNYKNVQGRFQRDSEGNEVWVLTFKRAWNYVEEQWKEDCEVSIRDAPEYIDEPGLSPVKAEHDFAILKFNTDVIVFGKARTKSKQPQVKHTCQLFIENHINKALNVVGERQWMKNGAVVVTSSPAPFIVKDIDYRHAIGGDEKNRYGSGLIKKTSELLVTQVPSIFYPSQDWSSKPSTLKVAGFGIEAPHFDRRRRYAGTFDQIWQDERKPLLPTDFDPRFYQIAPEDQQCNGFLSGGEKIRLSGFHHNDDLSFKVPVDKYVAFAEFEQSKQKNMDIYTIYIDTELNRVEITYSASFHCQGIEETLRQSTIRKV
ncbi:DUF2169 domain-containing protein [Vibrio sp. S4M6]|uniref:DUF2169 family type VI secretion system accessory protein n=1 Tax=Vibrio sinus TaxID=2946865 RepID=UPI002029DA98|nr:DUF2169 domain-containing protein [Vibrio sinus]MCL9783482.1 DUF2169 domain-containing protein [Vibrio sinus]